MIHYIGAHINKESGSLIKTMEVIKNNGGNALQLFASNPRSASLPNMENYEKSANEIRNYCVTNNFKLVIHASYTINLAKEMKINKRSIDIKDCYWINLVLHELLVSDMIGAIGVVVHVGKYTNGSVDQGIKNMFEAISCIVLNIRDLNIKSKLIIETPAGAGTELLNDINDFVQFYNSFNTDQKKHLGICLDTAHIWSSGYDINEYYNIISKTNIKDIMVIHYNNSKKEKNSHVDTHETLFNGKIPIIDLEQFIKKFKNNKHIPMIILEKPSDKLEKEIKYIQELL